MTLCLIWTSRIESRKFSAYFKCIVVVKKWDTLVVYCYVVSYHKFVNSYLTLCLSVKKSLHSAAWLWLSLLLDCS